MEKNLSGISIIQTKRLTLREWKQEDLEAFALLNEDPRVMEHFPSTLDREASDQLAKRIKMRMEESGWGFWAVSVPDVANFIGFIGLSKPLFKADFTPTVEIGWRLAYPFWGNGYAVEGAQACLKFGFETLGLEEIVSFTAVQNRRSRKVMTRIGMLHESREDFNHPNIPIDHKLSRHVLYRIKLAMWQKNRDEEVLQIQV